jgi:hypothetical protein
LKRVDVVVACERKYIGSGAPLYNTRTAIPPKRPYYGRRISHGCLMGVYRTGVLFIGVHLTVVHLMGIHLMRIHFIDVCLMGVYLTGMCLMGLYLITYAALAAEFGLGTTDTGLPHRRAQPCNAYAGRVEL